jgi:xylulokinase
LTAVSEVHVLCLDIGTSSVKAAIVGSTRGVVAARTQSYPLLMPRPAWVEQDPVAIQRAVARAIRSLRRRGSDDGLPNAIAVTGQMFSLQPVAENGSPLGTMLSWLDQRASSHAARLAQRVPVAHQAAVTGGIITAKDIVPRIHWLREVEPERWARTRWLLDCKESVVAWLTGAVAIDPTGASAFRVTRGGSAWDAGACQLLDVPLDRLAPIRSATSIAGTLRASVARSLGLTPGLPVVVGAGDVPASQLGSGAVAPGDAHLSLGTAAYLGIVADRPLHDPARQLGPLAHVIGGQQLLWLEIATGGGALRWIGRALAHPNGADVLVDGVLERLAAQSADGMSGLLFAPWLSGERVPLFDDHARGAFVGLGLHHRAGHLVRAVLEGVAFQLRSAWDYGLRYGVTPGVVRVVGGGGGGRTWLGIIADALGRPLEVVAHPGDAAAVGVAATAFTALGAWRDAREVVRLVRVAERIEPDPQRSAAADASFARFARLAAALQPAQGPGVPA